MGRRCVIAGATVELTTGATVELATGATADPPPPAAILEFVVFTELTVCPSTADGDGVINVIFLRMLRASIKSKLVNVNAGTSFSTPFTVSTNR